MAMLENLKIEVFRGIKDLSISSLGQINLVVGDNNCGKTSVLEAIQLLRASGDGSLANIYKIAKQRENMFGLNTNSIYENFMCMFPKRADCSEIGVCACIGSTQVTYHITGKESKILIDSNELDKYARRLFEASGEGIETDVFDGLIEYGNDDIVQKENIHVNRYSRVSGTAVSSKDQIRIVYVSPFEHLRGNTISLIVKNEGYKEICLKALQLFDPDIEDMMIFRSDVGDRPVEYLKHKKLGNMPLSTYGDGIKKVLVLSNAVAAADGGILLIDEIETAIHKKYYDDIFRFIVKACKTFHVQAFITTHSIEAIDGLLETQDYGKQSDVDDITVITLKRENEATYSRVMPGRKVAENREAFGFEVRL
jgi:energy-coupling factor transporter ATP-binding protein EcfA2